MKQFITIVALAMVAVLGISINTCAQTTDVKSKVCNSEATTSTSPGRTKYVKDKCYNANSSNLESAVEKVVTKAIKESSSPKPSNGANEKSSYSGTEPKSKNDSGGTKSSAANEDKKSSDSKTSNGTNGGSSASKDSCDKGCSEKASAIREYNKNH